MEGLLRSLFAEELGVVLEVPEGQVASVVDELRAAGVPAAVIGRTSSDTAVVVEAAGTQLLSADMRDLRDTWEATSF